ncbi:FlbD [Arthroderma uncinatum]|uniref:FlbD n=1 Tax=Arthroderma uncinatum TaxID=74035 RepID=UPI00144A78FF|nr:FlbD [Arthroderma uncinatum]KAF3484134.1 FlbD [Arthroderma uncinatum]
MKYRSPKQCRERFHQNLKPTLNHDPISAEEGLVIERLVSEMGKRWAEIARRLGNRSDNAVKNWWNGSVNRKRRGMGSSASHSPSSSSPSRTPNGRVEPPYQKASSRSPSTQYRCPRAEHGVYGHSSHMDRQQSWTSISDYQPQHQQQQQQQQRDERDYHQSHLHSPRPLEYRSSLYDLPKENVSSGRWQQCNSRPESPATGRRLLTPIFTTRNSNQTTESAMTSPAFSELSHAPSLGGPPSMVSDHNSVASASPKTVTSPSALATPVEIHHSHHRSSSSSASSYDERRRGSAPLIPSSFSKPHHSSDNLLYQPHLMQSSLRHHQHSISAPHNQLPPISDLEKPSTSCCSTSRDSRMGLQALLN